jgi:SEC-C motif-containing protein
MRRNCPCGNNQTIENCCGAIIKGEKEALTAEELMRSRYTAFTKGNGDYLMASHSVNTRELKDKKDLENWAKSVTWMHLDVLNTTDGKANDTQGTVEFKAFFVDHGKVDVIHENSSFRIENGKWVYVGVV